MEQAFFFDFASPAAYLAAERMPRAEWVPVRRSGLDGPDPWDGWRCAAELDAAREDLVREAEAEGHVQPVRWPDPFPFDSDLALRAATFALTIGKVVAFSLAAFRQAYAGGRVLDEDTVMLAAAACEMHPRAVLQALGREAISTRLDEQTARARAAGVTAVPALV